MATHLRRSYGEGSCSSINKLDMDAGLWGDLQNHVDLKMIYAKLPIGDFFRLRQVCKEWNRLASDGEFLEESFKDHPIPKPYFVVGSQKMKHRLLAYDAYSHRWNWSRLPRAKCAVTGLLCDYHQHPDNCFGGPWWQDRAVNRVFNLHTRVFHALPILKEDEYSMRKHAFRDALIGMTVDTSVSPCSFQVILALEGVGTCIYDSSSNSWTLKPSSLPHRHLYQGIDQSGEDVQSTLTCAHWNGKLYFRVWSENDWESIVVCTYDLEKDEWDHLSTRSTCEEFVTYDIGVWQDRLFRFGLNAQPRMITAWELISNPLYSTEEWVLLDRMPENLCAWMLDGDADDDLGDREVVEMHSRFCGEYVLLYKCIGFEDVGDRAVLYNLDRKTWERVEVPGPRRWVSSHVCRAEKDRDEKERADRYNAAKAKKLLLMKEAEGREAEYRKQLLSGSLNEGKRET